MIRANKDKYYIFDEKHNCWMHRTPLKCFINPILRKIQFWTDKPFVIYSNTEFFEMNFVKTPHFIGYGFGRIKYKKFECEIK